MTEWKTLNADDGHTFDAYVCRPQNTPKGVVMVLQEIFGVNGHIREVCQRFADEGFLAVAPALFDRQQRGFEAGYSDDDVARSRAFLKDLDFEAACRDMAAVVTEFQGEGRVGVVGFCLGGSLAYLAAARDERLAASICYYGRLIPDFAEDETPRCPTILHFGETDDTIPIDNVDLVREVQPDLPVYLYPAGHGFNCDHRSAYDESSASLAWGRTLALLNRMAD